MLWIAGKEASRNFDRASEAFTLYALIDGHFIARLSVFSLLLSNRKAAEDLSVIIPGCST
jgi:hypothetical protein